jgi:hypothetical protein
LVLNDYFCKSFSGRHYAKSYFDQDLIASITVFYLRFFKHPRHDLIPCAIAKRDIARYSLESTTFDTALKISSSPAFSKLVIGVLQLCLRTKKDPNITLVISHHLMRDSNVFFPLSN